MTDPVLRALGFHFCDRPPAGAEWVPLLRWPGRRGLVLMRIRIGEGTRDAQGFHITIHSERTWAWRVVFGAMLIGAAVLGRLCRWVGW